MKLEITTKGKNVQLHATEIKISDIDDLKRAIKLVEAFNREIYLLGRHKIIREQLLKG